MLKVLLILFANIIPAMHAIDATDVPSVAGGQVYTSDDALSEIMAITLRNDEEKAASVARRINTSSLSEFLAASQNPQQAESEILAWIQQNPASAAHLAIGFEKDDARGDKSFENSLFYRIKRYFSINPGRHQGLLGRLEYFSTLSKTVAKNTRLNDADRQQLIKQLFEGQSTTSGKIDDTPGQPGAGQAGSGPAVASTPYDRLSDTNITGYSPDVLAFQSEMNQRRPPGAPRLIETGKLNYPTLHFPFYSLSYDIKNLRENYDLQRARTLTAKLEKALQRRARALEYAQKALNRFSRETEKVKNPKLITKKRLVRLSNQRRDAARWITVASLEETLFNLKLHAGFMTPQLRLEIQNTPVEQNLKRAYLNAGIKIEKKISQAIYAGALAIELLVARDPHKWSRAQTLIAQARGAFRHLPGQIKAYKILPPQLIRTHKITLETDTFYNRWMLKLMPTSSSALKLKKAREDERKIKNLFTRVASRK